LIDIPKDFSKLQTAVIHDLQTLLHSGTYVWGFAGLPDPMPEKYKNYPGAVSIARKMDSPIMDGITQGPTREYFDLYLQVNQELNTLVIKITEVFGLHGIPALPLKATVSDSELEGTDYSKTLRTEFSHKMAACRAGLGWIGKTDLLVTRAFGPRVRLAAVLFDADFVYGKPVTESKCGSCRICVDACPAGAATGQSWHTGLDRDEFYNPFTCREMCKKLSAQRLGEDISICGICVSVCPWGKLSRGWDILQQ
jgi:epoxyqueuosine reductase